MQANRTDKAGPKAVDGASDGCTCFRLRSLARITGRHYDAHLSAAGLKTTQYSLLSALLRGGPMRAADLARLLALEPSTLTRNLEPLVQAGWVESSVGGDRRTRLLGLTTEGLRQRRRARAHWVRAQLELERQLGQDTVVQLHRLLDHCRGLLEADAGGCEWSAADARGGPVAGPVGNPARGSARGSASVGSAPDSSSDPTGPSRTASSPTTAQAARSSRSRRKGAHA